jgi:hypothetical protein
VNSDQHYPVMYRSLTNKPINTCPTYFIFKFTIEFVGPKYDKFKI